MSEDPDFILENGARAIFSKEARVNCHNGDPLSGSRLCVSISAFLLWLALFLASSHSLAPGHICLGRLDRRALWTTTPELPSSAGDGNSWPRSGATENTCCPVSTDLSLTSLVQLPFLPFLFSSVTIPELFFAPHLPPNPCFKGFLRIDVSLAWFRIESNGRGGGRGMEVGGWGWGMASSSASGSLSPSAPAFSLNSCNLTGDGLRGIPPKSLLCISDSPSPPCTPHRVTLPWFDSFVPPIKTPLDFLYFET